PAAAPRPVASRRLTSRAARRCRGSAASGRSRGCRARSRGTAAATGRARRRPGGTLRRHHRTAASARRACPCRHTCAARAVRDTGTPHRPARPRPSGRARAPRRAPPGRRPPGPARRERSRARPPRYVESSAVSMALAERTLDLVDIPSESGNEAALYDYVRASVPLDSVYDDGESILFAKRSGKPLVLLAGHTDTVPAQGNLPGRIDDGAVIGLGASDMKGGLAVMIELARRVHEVEPAYDVGFLFFPREELGPLENPLPRALARTPGRDEAPLRRSARRT